jgi:hypothetical protein
MSTMTSTTPATGLASRSMPIWECKQWTIARPVRKPWTIARPVRESLSLVPQVGQARSLGSPTGQNLGTGLVLRF